MKYLLYEQVTEEIIYCNKNGKETTEDIAKTIANSSEDLFVGKFIAKEYIPANSPIKNDGDMFILKDTYGHDYIWQICEKVSDYTNTIVPHLYRVRRIGIVFD